MKTPPFTMEHAMLLQAQHLKMWESILKPEIFAVVERRVASQNEINAAEGDTNPYNVCRGCHIDQIVHNLQTRFPLFPIGTEVEMKLLSGCKIGTVARHCDDGTYILTDTKGLEYQMWESEMTLPTH